MSDKSLPSTNADWAKAHQRNVWQRMQDGDGPYLHDMETRQLLMQSAQVHALLAIADAISSAASVGYGTSTPEVPSTP